MHRMLADNAATDKWVGSCMWAAAPYVVIFIMACKSELQSATF